MDIEKNCKGIYHSQGFEFKNYQKLIKKHNYAWKHSKILEEEQYQYLYIFLKSEDLQNYTENPEEYSNVKKMLEAHKKAALLAKIDLSSSCVFDIVPEHRLEKWFSMRQSALENLLSKKETPSDYDILHKAHVLVSNIKNQKIRYGNELKSVNYDIFGSVTGRLTTVKGSVPVLTLKKEQRSMIKPKNDAIVEFDLNAAEIRTLLGLQGIPQPEGDIHKWIGQEVYNESINRAQVKQNVFSWLYNFSAPKNRLDEIFSRQIFRDFYCFEKQILKTPFGRNLNTDERKAQNYLLQSTTSDQVIENAYRIQKMLHGKKSEVAFLLHDSIILDMSKEDVIMLGDIKSQFEQTRWGNFVSTCKVGKDFGNLRELKI